MLGTSGDTNLGGEDFDNILVDIVLNKVQRYVDTNQIRESKEAMRKLKISCENAKKLLSLVDIAHIRIYNIVENVDIFLKIERSEFEEGCKPLFDKLKKPIKSALEMAKLDSDKIEEVILVGGSTRIPKIKKYVSNYFLKSKINDSINPDEVVAFGATIEAEKILHNKDKNIKNITLLDIVPFSLGTDIVNNSTNEEIKKEGDLMDVIIKRGSSLNTPKSKKYRTTQDDQTIMPIKIYEGDNKYVKYNHLFYFLKNNYHSNNHILLLFHVLYHLNIHLQILIHHYHYILFLFHFFFHLYILLQILIFQHNHILFQIHYYLFF